MQKLVVLFGLVYLISVITAESVRATEILHPSEMDLDMASGLPDDDEDRFPESSEEEEEEDYSGSGDDYDDSEQRFEEGKDVQEPTSTKVPEMDNRIPDDNTIRVDSFDDSGVEGNEIPIKKSSASENESNQIPMASKANESIFERTEVLAALIVGGAVGLLFAVLLILLLVYRMKKKDEGTYDLGKKPIYKKAPTNEFYA
ncbi:syndecan-4 [Protopterus annectens]|uniref:syndecan-4 n=1 Tax=Protopterus annectens TaxID=7888 RepID=UPI001CFB39B6|nr:syndecan-4 [Protopterus annectens]